MTKLASDSLTSSTNQLLVTLDGSVSMASITRAIRLLRGVASISHPKKKHRLYDPETGKAVNEKTMRAIENAKQGRDISFTGNFEEFKKMAEDL